MFKKKNNENMKILIFYKQLKKNLMKISNMIPF